jgi:hypothetical protein
MLRVCLVPFWISVHDLIPFSGRARRGLRSAKWPGPARRAPGAHTPPCAPSPLSLSHLDLPRNNIPLPLPPLSPRGALGVGDGDHRNLDPEVSSPPLLLSLSLSLLFFLPPRAPSLSPARARPCPSPARGGARPPSSPPGGDPAPSPCSPARPRPRPLLARGGPDPALCSRAVAPPRPLLAGARRPPARPLPARRSPGPAPCSPGAAPGAAPRRLGPGAAPAWPFRPRCSPSPLRAASRPSAWFAWPWRGLALPRLPLARSRVRKPALAVIIFGR